MLTSFSNSALKRSFGTSSTGAGSNFKSLTASGGGGGSSTTQNTETGTEQPKSELDAYKYLLAVAEQMVSNACPPELMRKFFALKEISLQRVTPGSASAAPAATPVAQFSAIQTQFLDTVSALLQRVLEENDTRALEIQADREVTRKCRELADSAHGVHEKLIKFDAVRSDIMGKVQAIRGVMLRNSEELQRQHGKLIVLEQAIKKMEVELDQKQLSVQTTQQIQSLQDENARLKRQYEDAQKKLFDAQTKAKSARDAGGVPYEELQAQVKAEREKNDRLQEKLQDTERNAEECDHLFEIIADQFGAYIDKYGEAYADFVQRSAGGGGDAQYASQQNNLRQSANNGSVIAEPGRADLIFFVAFLLNKFEEDNSWLVDRLTELGKENSRLKDDITQLKGTPPNIEKFKSLREQLEMAQKNLMQYEKGKEQWAAFLNETEKQQENLDINKIEDQN